jgi:hypothetical protein
LSGESIFFSPSLREQVRGLLLEECGENLPVMKGKEESVYDRMGFAALKLSDGDLERLR